MLSKKTILIITIISLLLLTGFVQAQDIQWVTHSRIGNPDAEITLTMWMHRSYGPQSEMLTRRQGFIERAESWARKNPNVKIDIAIDMPGDAIHENMVKLLEASKAGNAPDMATLDSFWVPRFIDAESKGILKSTLQPLNKFLTEKETNDFYPAFVDFVSDDEGEIKAFFFNTDVRPLFYRKDLVKNPPKTWTELIEQAQKIMEENPEIREGFLTEGGRYENAVFNFWGTYWASGGKLVDETGKPSFNTGEDREKMLKLLRLLKNLVDSGVMPMKVASLDTSSSLDAAIANSKPPFALGGNWRTESLKQLLGEDEFNKKWDIALAPVFEGDKPVTGAGGWTQAIFTDDPKKKALSFDFLWYVYGGLKGMSTTVPPSLATLRPVIEEYAPIQNNEMYVKSSEMLEYAGLRPGVPIYPDISRAFQIAFSEVILGSKTPEEALDDAWERVMDVYQE